MSNEEWDRARKKIKRRNSLALQDKDGIGELRFTEYDNYVVAQIGKESVKLDYYTWKALNQVEYELHIAKPEKLDQALDDLTKEEAKE